MPKVKICGLSRMQDIIAANASQVDYVGFVFADSKRQINIEQAAGLKLELSPDILVVGVFVNADISVIIELLQRKIINIIQLHGQESEAYINELRQSTDVPIIKAFGITTVSDIELAQDCSADYVLLDNKQAGSGQSFDWQLLDNIQRPFFLAGGLNIDNIQQALHHQPFALDISSGVETNEYKDAEKIKQIVRRIRHE